jgi:hypothetical protein
MGNCGFQVGLRSVKCLGIFWLKVKGKEIPAIAANSDFLPILARVNRWSELFHFDLFSKPTILERLTTVC